MEEKHKKVRVSLRTYITAHSIVICVIALVTLLILEIGMYHLGYNDQTEEKILKECTYLVNDLSTDNLTVAENSRIDGQIEAVASGIRGRIIIVNSDYKVIKDTYQNIEGSYIVNQELMKIMTGRENKYYKRDNSSIQYIFPVKKDNENIGAVIVSASLGKMTGTEHRIITQSIIACAILIVLISIFYFFVGWGAVRGINSINKKIESMREGRIDQKLEEKGFKEYTTLTRNYNETVNKLMVIDSSRQEFVSNVSHELKTPITSMKVLADSLIQNEDATLEMYKEFMTDIVEEIDRESKIISDLLTLVKMDKQSAEINIEQIDINNLLEIIIKRVSPIAASRNIEISYEKHRDVVADVDEVKLSLALSNIIENAVKYNVDNGWVKVSLNADHKHFYVKVADSGVGIPDDCKNQVFERFYRVDKARSRDTGGTGLGLAITKSVILMHKGTVKLYSQSGEGSTFTIKIPLSYVEQE